MHLRLKTLLLILFFLIISLSTLTMTEAAESFHPYDADQNWTIEDFELLDAIDDWAAGNLGDFGLLDLIDFWAAGCYQWDTSSGSYISACDNASGKSNASLNGEYIISYFYSDPETAYITASFDGNGTVTLIAVDVSNGSSVGESAAYSVNPDGTFSVKGIMRGIISPDDNILTLVDTDSSDGYIGLDVGIKKSSGKSNASLNGEYIISYYYSDPKTAYIKVTFDGNGTVTFDSISISDGSSINGSGSYSVNPDGTFTVAGIMRGMISPDNNILTLVDTDSSDGYIALEVGVKKSSGKSNASLNGEYIISYYYSDPETAYIAATFDGNGTVTLNSVYVSNNSSIDGSGSYSVNSDGSFTVEGVMRGMISQDNNILTLVDTDMSDNYIGLDVGIKKTLECSEWEDSVNVPESGCMATQITIDVVSYANINSRWEYKKTENGVVDNWALEVSGTTTKNGKSVYLLQEYSENNNPNDQHYYLTDMSQGLYMSGGANHVSGSADEEFFYQPEMPYLLSVFVPGQEYSYNFARTDNAGTLTHTVKIEKESVTVPAGTYTDCFKSTVTHIVGGSSYIDTLWYAKDVGLVKRIQGNNESIWELTLHTNIFSLSEATIVIDGVTDDWSGIDPFFGDAEGDTVCEDGTDIKAVYLAKDADYLYWRMDTWSGTFESVGGSFGKGPGVVFYSYSDNREVLKGVEASMLGTSVRGSIATRDYGSNWVYWGGGPEYGKINQVAEGKIPISLFGTNTINSVLGWYHAGYPNELCDDVFRSVDSLF